MTALDEYASVVAARLAELQRFAESLPAHLPAPVSGRTHAALFGIAGRHQGPLQAFLTELEGLGSASSVDGSGFPQQAAEAHAAVSRFLSMYGRRDHHGSVETVGDEPIGPWRPSDAGVDPDGRGSE